MCVKSFALVGAFHKSRSDTDDKPYSCPPVYDVVCAEYLLAKNHKSFAQLGDLHRQWRNIWEDTLVKNTSSVIIFVLVFLCQLFYTFWGLLFLVFYTLAPSLFGLYRFLYLCVVPAYKPYIDSTSSNTSERKKLLRCTDNFFDTVHFLLYFYEHSTAQQLIS